MSQKTTVQLQKANSKQINAAKDCLYSRYEGDSLMTSIVGQLSSSESVTLSRLLFGDCIAIDSRTLKDLTSLRDQYNFDVIIDVDCGYFFNKEV